MTPPLFVPALGRSLYPGASVALDFTRNLYRSGTPVVKGSPSLLSGWTFARASTGYAETAAGALVAFASGAPRITDKGLLVEEARTNLLQRSQEFDNASWTKTNATITANATTAPDGTLTAELVVDDATNADHKVRQGVAITSGTTYTVSVYAKAGTLNYVWLYAGTPNVGKCFDLANGTVLGNVGGAPTSAEITALGNGWYRCSMTYTAGATSSQNQDIGLSVNGTTFNYAGTGLGAYIWGAQIEAGTSPTSYIPTTSAQATRQPDVAYITGVATPSAGYTPVVEFAPVAAITTNSYQLAFDDGTAANRAFIYLPGAMAPFYLVTAGGVGVANAATGGTSVDGSAFKAALRVNANDFQAAGGGTLGTADTSGALPTAPTVLRIGSAASLGSQANSYIRRAILYPTAFTDAQLQAATA